MLTRANSRLESFLSQSRLRIVVLLLGLLFASVAIQQLQAQTIVIEDLVLRTINIDELGGIQPNSTIDLKAYPIPTTNPVNFQTVNGSRILAIQIIPKFVMSAYNGNANISYTKAAQNKVTLYVSNLPKGVYIARVYTDMGFMQVNLVR